MVKSTEKPDTRKVFKVFNCELESFKVTSPSFLLVGPFNPALHGIRTTMAVVVMVVVVMVVIRPRDTVLGHFGMLLFVGVLVIL